MANDKTGARVAGAMRIRAVLFDLGGTLIDEKDFDGWTELLRRFYLDIPPDQLRHAFYEVEAAVDASPRPQWDEDGLIDFWRRTLSRAAETNVDLATTRKFLSAVREEERPVRLYSDTRRCLDALRAERRRLGVVSNSTSEAAIRRLLDRGGILDYFERVLSSGTEGVAKPNPEIFRRAVGRMQLRPDEVVFVGNLPHTDALAATAAGLHGVWLNREGFGYGTDPPEITSLLEVPLVVHHLEEEPAPSGRRTADSAR